VHVSGSHTDGSEQGKIIRARVEGKAENALLRLPLRAVHDMRPSLMKPVLGPRNVKASYRMMLLFYRATNLLLPGLGSSQVARAMLRCAREGAPQRVLEPADIAALAAGVRGFFHPPISLRRGQFQHRLDQRASVGQCWKFLFDRSRCSLAAASRCVSSVRQARKHGKVRTDRVLATRHWRRWYPRSSESGNEQRRSPRERDLPANESCL